MSSNKITHANVRMYRMGTGDCFVIKFMHNAAVKFKMMIDGGAWQGSRADLTPFVKDLKKYVGNHLHLLVVTHEHKDHVLAFERCKSLFTDNFTVDQIWMGWTENDKSAQAKRWQDDFGQKKRALAMAAEYLGREIKDGNVAAQLAGSKHESDMLKAREAFSNALEGFAELHLAASAGKYVGNLKGMKVVKEDIADDNIRYLEPGDIETVDELEGVRFFVLGPPKQWKDVETETGAAGETYEHNKDLEETDAFAAAALALDGNGGGAAAPFEENYVSAGSSKIQDAYEAEPWRKIDYEWLHGAGSLALRVNSLTNNLSVVLAIEFEENGRVMLFPGDAEYGSWRSWHKIDWGMTGKDKDKHLTEDLLNRTVFYKVAHHLSHNGTARRKGLEMMTDPDLAAMATLDYSVISNGWKSTMPNRAILKELLKRTKGRVMVMNVEELFYNESKNEKLSDKIEEAQNKMNNGEWDRFLDDYDEHELYLQFRVRA